MIKEIQYKDKNHRFLGRNGSWKQYGIVISEADKTITLCPITSKGGWGNCELVIPKEDLEEFVKHLLKIK